MKFTFMTKAIVLPVLFATVTIPANSQQPSPPLTLERVVRLYIDRNLELQAEKYRLERTKADAIAARMRPNPGLSVTAENLKVSGPLPAGRLYEIGMAYSDTIELGGKRRLRENVAAATISAAEARFSDSMRKGVAEVKRLYFVAVLARRDIEVATENRQMFEQLVQLNLARFQEGAIPEADLIKVRLERIKFDSALKQAQLGLRQAMIRLAENLEDDAVAKQEVAPGIDLRLLNPDLNSLIEVALRERPDVQAAQRDVEAAKEKLALEESRAKPDISPFAGYKRIGADNTLMFGVNVPLKVRDRNQAGIARAEADQKAAAALLEVAKSHTIAEVSAAYEALITSREQVQTFRDELLNQADESRSIALVAYEEGATPLLAVLEAQRTRADVRQQYFRTLFDYEVSLSELELAVGKEIQP
jgi:cobalt-zinc-cadmium efflux system outer membrane protein